MGRSTRRPAPSTAVQSTAAPPTCTPASDARNRAAPPSPRRSVPATVTGAEAFPAMSSQVSVIAAASTGCGDTSMNIRRPEAASTRMAWSNSTGARKLSYQYRAPASGPSSTSPVIAETIGIRAGPGAIPASAATISARSRSTCPQCEA